jgi:hypothetical protein
LSGHCRQLLKAALASSNRRKFFSTIIHSVTNPIRRLTGAIHVYGGDFFHAERSEWDPETLLDERYDGYGRAVRHPPLRSLASAAAIATS